MALSWGCPPTEDYLKLKTQVVGYNPTDESGYAKLVFENGKVAKIHWDDGSVLEIGNSWSNWQVISSDTTLTDRGNYAVDTSSGDITITLPSSGDITDFMCRLKNVGDGTLYIQTQGTDTIDGESSYTANVQYESVSIGDVGNGKFYIF